MSEFYEFGLRPNFLYTFDRTSLGRLEDRAWVSKKAKHKTVRRSSDGLKLISNCIQEENITGRPYHNIISFIYVNMLKC